MKEKIKKVAQLIVIILIMFFIIFILSFAFFNLFYKFDIISFRTYLILALCLTILILVIFIIMHYLSEKIMFISKIEKWLAIYQYRIMLFAVIFLLFVNSLDKEVFISIDDAKDIISLQWTIFGISITIFIVWNILAQQIFDKKIEFVKNENKINMLKSYLDNKKEYIEHTQNKSYTLSLILVNIFVLLGATAILYLVNWRFDTLKQTVVIFSFYFCTNTLLQLFLDILQPLLKKKKEVMKSVKKDKNSDYVIEQTIVLYNQLNSLAISDKEKEENKQQLQIIIDKICEIKGIECIQEQADKETK